MTTNELIAYYAGLLILQYRGKQKAYDTMKALVKPAIMDQLMFAIRDAFNVDTAVGAQLDTIGKYAGVSRTALTFSGAVVLSDADYRTMIKMRLVQNNSGSSLSDIVNLLQKFLPNALSVFDHQNMSMSYYFNSAFGSEQLAEAFVRQDLLPKPMGVQLGSLIYIANVSNIFGMRSYTLGPVNVSGFNTYADYQMDQPWLQHSNAIAL